MPFNPLESIQTARYKKGKNDLLLQHYMGSVLLRREVAHKWDIKFQFNLSVILLLQGEGQMD